MQGQHGLTVEVEADAAAEPAVEQVRLFFFDAVRELLLNIVKHANVDRAQVRTRTLESGDIEVTVSDSGVGFEPAPPGVPASATGGFGLFGIRERLGYLGGRMVIDAAPGRGSRFTLAAPARLAPLQAATGQTAGTQLAATPQAAGPAERALLEPERKIRILLADDHPVMRQGLAKLLREQPDMQVIGEAGDGRQAVDLARQLKPEVVLMDVSLPGINGFDATRQIVSEFPEIRVIGFSMHEETDMSDTMLKAGAVAYMSKNGPIEHLIAAIRESGQSSKNQVLPA
jgi:CheY-like chemotaxis protein